MAERIQTAITLTNFASQAKERLCELYSFKLVASSGIALLDALPAKEREDFMRIIAKDRAEEIQAVVDEYAAVFSLKGTKRK